jgi:hypothetical protein
MRVLVLALALLPGAAMAEDLSVASKPKIAELPYALPKVAKARTEGQCANATNRFVGSADQAVRARPLKEEPRANRYLPVLRMVEGCDTPVMIGEQVEGK